MTNAVFNAKKCPTKAELTALLNDELSPAELHAIEDHLLDCQLCSEAVDGYRSQQVTEVFDFKKALIDKNMNAPEISPTPDHSTGSKKSWLNFNRIAATFLLGFLCYAAFQYSNYHAELQRQNQLTEDFRQMGNNFRSETEKKQGALGHALSLYENNQLELAIKALNELREQQTDNPEIAYYLGMAYAKNKQPHQATHWLSVARINLPDKYEQASWQLVLTYLDANQKQEAIKILEDLAQMEESVFHEDALELLKELQD